MADAAVTSAFFTGFARSATIAAGCAIGASAFAADLPRTTSAGPFDVVMRPTKIGSGGFPNRTSNPFARVTVTVFDVRYRGKRVAVADGKTSIDEFWEAKVLAGAPRPAVLVAQTGVYLLSERDARLDVQVLAPATTDIARWQWLDARSGQPGPEFSVTIRDASAEPPATGGGRLLLLNRTRVLDVAGLASYAVSVNSHENVERIGGYNAGNEQARALSPRATQYVSVGSRYADGMFEYALVAAEYASGRVYAVPFDRNALRFESVWDATPEWIAHHFEWTDDAGAERLALRTGAKPMPWQGRFSRSPGGMVEFIVHPTRPDMLDALAEYVRATFGGQISRDDATTRTAIVDGQTLRIAHFERERRTVLYAQPKGAAPPYAGYALVEKIGARFNEPLRRGDHDGLFTTYPAGT
jgi:hypothetical protein